MPQRIVVAGSSANPPHLGHVAFIHALITSERFDSIIWVPCGARADKRNLASPEHRITMTMNAFPPSWFHPQGPIELCLDDVFGENTPTIRRLEALRAERGDSVQLSWATGIDVLVPSEQYGGRSEVAATWIDGEQLVRWWPVVVVPRQGFPHPSMLDLPPRARVLDGTLPEISSSEIRRRITSGEPFDHLVPPEVARYITRFHLYT